VSAQLLLSDGSLVQFTYDRCLALDLGGRLRWHERNRKHEPLPAAERQHDAEEPDALVSAAEVARQNPRVHRAIDRIAGLRKKIGSYARW
jgi:hypothetical protein